VPVVSKRPRVGVIATGDELVDPWQVPGAAQIRNTNAFQLGAQARRVGTSVTNYGIARDAAEDISRILCKALGENDVALTAGGVCVGEFDLVRKVMRENGVELLFEKVGAKPGRPMAFGIRRQAFCFALPGNPVSGFVMFELMVRPFLYKMMGHTYRPATSRARLQEAIIREKGDRDTWVPVVFAEPATVAEVGYQGPQGINALCAADGLVCLPVGVGELQAGTDVIVRHI
jgi:molybdopterin molybdotransferase